MVRWEWVWLCGQSVVCSGATEPVFYRSSQVGHIIEKKSCNISFEVYSKKQKNDKNDK